MSNFNENKIDQNRLAMAALFASLVKTLGNIHPNLPQEFENELKKCYDSMEDAKVTHTGAMETLIWTKDFLHEN